PAPCVYRISSVRPCFLKMPAFCPSSGAAFSQLPRWPIASLRVPSADAEAAASGIATARRQRTIAASLIESLLASSAPIIRGGCRGANAHGMRKKGRTCGRLKKTQAEESMLSAGDALQLPKQKALQRREERASPPLASCAEAA